MNPIWNYECSIFSCFNHMVFFLCEGNEKVDNFVFSVLLLFSNVSAFQTMSLLCLLNCRFIVFKYIL